MRRSIRFSFIVATLAFVVGGPIGKVSGGIIVEDYKMRDVLGVTTSGKYDPQNTYKVDGVSWEANLDPLHPQELQLGGTTTFLDILEAAYPGSAGWSYVTAAQDLSPNSLKVHSYDVHGDTDFVGIEGNAAGDANIGFDVEYAPTKGSKDPTKSVQWIQVVTEKTFDIAGNLLGSEEFVDVPAGSKNPYYNSASPIADSRNFLDAPVEPDIDEAHTWTAELYLVTGPNFPGEVTIYDGIQWGWENHPTPEPASAVLFGVGLAGIIGYGWRRRRNGPHRAG